MSATQAAAAAAAPAAAPALFTDVERYRAAHEAQIVEQLAALVRVRSIAADHEGLGAAAQLLVAQLKERGFAAQEWRADPRTPPLVFGTLTVPGAKRTVVYYAHYDGQPVTPSQWNSDPFIPTLRTGILGSGERVLPWQPTPGTLDREWRLYGRAVADDKASIIAFLTAMDALRSSGRRPSVNIKVVWEGEEEAGSAHLAQVLRAHRSQLEADLWLIGDGPVHQSGRAMLYFGARGSIGLRLTVYGPKRALHDGHYGNWVPNPATLAAHLIAQMRAEDGSILIPGFDANVRPLTAEERAALARLPDVDAALKREFGIAASEGPDPLPLSLMRPALNVRGLRAGQVGDAAANAIATEAEISIDFRLVPDQTTDAVKASVEDFLRNKGWTLTTGAPDEATRLAHARLIRVEWEPGYPAWRSSLSTPVAQAVIASASRAAREPVAVLPMMGGSVPLYLFENIFHQPLIGVPIVNYDDNQHAANENLRLGNLWDGIETYAFLMADLHW